MFGKVLTDFNLKWKTVNLLCFLLFFSIICETGGPLTLPTVLVNEDGDPLHTRARTHAHAHTHKGSPKVGIQLYS
jgi:hypothetical protein